MSKKVLISIYLWLRRYIFGGRGLSRVPLVRNITFAIEKFLRGGGLSTITKHGVVIHLDPRGSVAGKFEEYEPESTQILKHYLQPGSTFVDVGASIGWFSLIAAKLVGSTGKVYSFEPEPNSFELLKRNARANNLDGIIAARQAAVSSQNGKVKLYVTGNAWTWSSLDDPRSNPGIRIEANFSKSEDRTVREYEVESVLLDDCLQGKVDLIKIDVEASWVTDEVFLGMQKTILQNPNLKLLIEHPSKEIIGLLKKLGYSYRFLDNLNGFFSKE